MINYLDTNRNRKVVVMDLDISRAFGDKATGIILCQFLYWRTIVGDRAIYKTQAEIEKETLVTKYEQVRIFDRLKKDGFVTIERKGLPAKNHYKFDWDKINAFVNDQLKSDKTDPDPDGGGNGGGGSIKEKSTLETTNDVITVYEAPSPSKYYNKKNEVTKESSHENNVESVNSTQNEQVTTFCRDSHTKEVEAVKTVNSGLGKPSAITENTTKNTTKSTNIFNNRSSERVIKTKPPTADEKPKTKTKVSSTDSLKEAFKVFWEAGMRKVDRMLTEKVFTIEYKAYQKEIDESISPLAFAEMLAKDVQKRIEIGQYGFENLNPKTYLEWHRWEDEIKAPVMLNKQKSLIPSDDSFGKRMALRAKYGIGINDCPYEWLSKRGITDFNTDFDDVIDIPSTQIKTDHNDLSGDAWEL
ncbi:Uncharacterised protein [Oligella urethralis]|uniref:hypothetical protein n=1 Tax=Oligella urethralis TaxID=90245 RepID=UPI000DFF225E|nr:hypothetical protein [Oligella urethralis]SUA61576.1 Uncharacterised protein [Oligella urethralis]